MLAFTGFVVFYRRFPHVPTRLPRAPRFTNLKARCWYAAKKNRRIDPEFEDEVDPLLLDEREPEP